MILEEGEDLGAGYAIVKRGEEGTPRVGLRWNVRVWVPVMPVCVVFVVCCVCGACGA